MYAHTIWIPTARPHSKVTITFSQPADPERQSSNQNTFTNIGCHRDVTELSVCFERHCNWSKSHNASDEFAELLKEPVRSLVEPSFQGTTAKKVRGIFSSATMVLWNRILYDYRPNARTEGMQFQFHVDLSCGKVNIDPPHETRAGLTDGYQSLWNNCPEATRVGEEDVWNANIDSWQSSLDVAPLKISGSSRSSKYEGIVI